MHRNENKNDVTSKRGGGGAADGASYDPAFQLVVKTDNAGSSNDDEFTLPLKSGETYNFDVDWGDGTTDTITTDSSPTHTYASAGTYTILITENVVGGFPAIYFNGGGDKDKALEIANWGSGQWGTLESAFYGCSNLTITATDEAQADLSQVTIMYRAWFNCSSLTGFPALDTSNVTNMSQTWEGCSGLTSFPAIDTANVTTMEKAWRGCSSLTGFPALNAASVTNMSKAWNNCSGLTSFPALDTSSVTNMEGAWFNCSSLTGFPTLDTSSVTNMSQAWNGCSNLTSFPALNTSNVTIMYRTWYDCSGLTSFPALDTSSVTNMSQTWDGCSNIADFLATGMSVDFALPCNLDAAALDTVYTNLADLSSGSGATITVTGNPGTSGDDEAIATAKNWTVVS